MKKTYSVRLEIKIQADNDSEAKRLTELLIKEQPRLENSTFGKASIYNSTDHRIVAEEI